MPLEIRGAHFFNSECTISAGNTLRIGTAKRYYPAHSRRLSSYVKLSINVPCVYYSVCSTLSSGAYWGYFNIDINFRRRTGGEDAIICAPDRRTP